MKENDEGKKCDKKTTVDKNDPSATGAHGGRCVIASPPPPPTLPSVGLEKTTLVGRGITLGSPRRSKVEVSVWF